MNKQNELYHHYRMGGLTMKEAYLAVENNPDAEMFDDVWMTLMGAFIFDHSPQGNNFWQNIATGILKK